MNLSWKVKFIIALIAFIIIVIADFIILTIKMKNILKGKKKKKGDIIVIEVQYLFFKYKIVKERLYNAKFASIFALINSFIICATFLVTEIVSWHLLFKLLLGFVFLMGLIYSLYGILGSILVKRGYKNEYK